MSRINSLTSNSHRLARTSALFWLATLSVFAHCQAQEASPPAENQAGAPTSQITLADVQRQLKDVDALTDIDDGVREELRGIYEEAIRELTTASDVSKRILPFVEMRNGVAEQLEQARARKAQTPTGVTIDIPGDLTPVKLESLRKAAEKAWAEAKLQREQLEAEPGRRRARRTEISTTVKTLLQTRQRLQSELAAKRPSDRKSAAVVTGIQAKIQSTEAELALYQEELAAYDATTNELLPLKLELAELEASLCKARLELWLEKEKEQETRDARRDKGEAQEKEKEYTGALKTLAQRNSELADEKYQLAAKSGSIEVERKHSTELLDTLQRQSKVTREKVETVGLSYAIGLLLRQEASSLPDVSKYKRASRERRATIRAVQLRMIDLRVERLTLTNINYVKSFVDGVQSLPEHLTREQFESEATALVERRLELLTSLSQSENDFFERLIELDSTQQQLCEAVAEYETYINERVLWIRSSDPIAWSDLRSSVSAIRWFADKRSWQIALSNLAIDLKKQSLPALLLLGLWAVLLLFQRRLRLAITQAGEQAGQGSCRTYVPTVLSLAWTLLITALWPLLILIVAWRFAQSAGDSTFALALSTGLTTAGVYYLTLEFLRQVCRTKGLADSHFGWPLGIRITLRSNLRWLMGISVPLVFVAAVLYANSGSRSESVLQITGVLESAARLFIIGTLIAAAVFCHRALRPSGRLYASAIEESPGFHWYRMRRITYSTMQLLLGSLLLLAIVGYDFTVAQLVRRLYESILLLEVLVVVMALSKRWLVVMRRRLAIAQAQQRRLQMETQGEFSGALGAIAIAENAPDLVQIGEQSRRLLHSLLVIMGLAGLWFIWIDVIPALNFFERFKLWSVTEGATTAIITVNDVIVAGVVIVATILATRNIPGLLEITILSRLPLDAGNRYAIITICRYLLAIVGIILSFGAIGVSWSRIQWLVAAVTVGLGFGLQEIFANFVSGLIVLFEQPIRVGDVITIGDVTGVVSRIRMRATTVTNWDRQELIVPNREFITGRLLNWTLSNTVNRVVITVGVAYGTDPDVAKRILLGIADEHPIVLDEPSPNVTFEQFGDSTLNLVLRCYLPDMENRLATIHQLNTAAQEKLNDAGIEFAFPTRELYIRSSLASGGSENALGAGE